MWDVEFEQLWAFYLLPLPLFFLLFKGKLLGQSTAVFLPLTQRQQSLSVEQGSNQKKRWFNSFLLLLAWGCLITSLARPIHLGDVIEINQTGRDVFLAVDLSGSMREEDMLLNNKKVDRLTLVKHVLDDFIAQRSGDRLGLILFGTQAFIQAPLTFDLLTLKTLLNESQIGFAGNKTAIGDAIGLGIKRLSEHDNDDKILILLTDGQNTAGSVDPIQASEMAAQEGVTIYTIAIGSDQPQSRSGVFSFGSYNSSADLDVSTLTTIAKNTGGQFYRATNQADLQAIYKTIDAQEEIDQDAQIFRPKQDWFYYPLAAFIALCSFVLVLNVISQTLLMRAK